MRLLLWLFCHFQSDTVSWCRYSGSRLQGLDLFVLLHEKPNETGNKGSA
jgi:hypothetical protein